MGTTITLTPEGTIVLDKGTGHSVEFSAHAREVEPAPDSPMPVPVRDPTAPADAPPDTEQRAKPGYPRLPPRTGVISPGYPRIPPRVMLIASGLHEEATESWGPALRRTRKVLPFSIRWGDLVQGHGPELAESLNLLRAAPRLPGAPSRMLNVFVSERDIAEGLKLDEVRARTSRLQLNVRGFNIFFAPKVTPRKK
jgi:hypothetical protein